MIVNHPRVRVCGDGEEAELLIPPHLKVETYPEWLRQRALERKPDYKDAWPNSDADAVSAWIEDLDAWEWLDHWGTAVYDGEEHLVSEPYHMNRERIDQLLRFCDEFNLKVSIQASGHHYPTQTMRIFVWPQEWNLGDHFLQEQEGYDDAVPEGEHCLAKCSTPSRRRDSHRARASAVEEAENDFALECDLRDHLAQNPSLLESGMTLWPVERGQSAVEFRVDGRNRRVDILARDANGIPTVIETKVHRGHERTVGQVLLYQERVRGILKMKKVRVVIVAKKISAELKAAAARLPDVSLMQYTGTKTFKRVSCGGRRSSFL